MMRYLLLVCSLLSVAASFAQPLVSWDTFAKVKMFREFDVNLGFEVNSAPPIFENDVLKYDGESIRVKGFVIPVDIELNLYMVSANPFANCFFCGNAGPETVVELFPGESYPRFKTDQVVTFVGKLNVNKGAASSTVPYQLFAAKVVK
jgi:hypothetical protein